MSQPNFLVPFTDQEIDRYCYLAEKANPKRAGRDPEGFGYCSAELLMRSVEFFPRLREELKRLYSIEEKFLALGMQSIEPASDLVQIQTP